VVTRDVPDYALVYGNPARIQGWMCQCGIRLEFHPGDGQEQAICEQCGEQYVKQGQTVKPQIEEAK
jgi:UDP-2-acetamido-3-amino-2,3-dideoxy-glucuronate N-acetyltransferase